MVSIIIKHTLLLGYLIDYNQEDAKINECFSCRLNKKPFLYNETLRLIMGWGRGVLQGTEILLGESVVSELFNTTLLESFTTKSKVIARKKRGVTK